MPRQQEPVVSKVVEMPRQQEPVISKAVAIPVQREPTVSKAEPAEPQSAADLFAQASDSVIPFSPAVFSPPTAQPSQQQFRPAWQVDHFSWPKLCRRLIARAGEELDRLADAMLEVHKQGNRVLGIAGCHRGEGATTLLLCAARRLAERGQKTVLVDADLTRPRLAKRLGLIK